MAAVPQSSCCPKCRHTVTPTNQNATGTKSPRWIPWSRPKVTSKGPSNRLCPASANTVNADTIPNRTRTNCRRSVTDPGYLPSQQGFANTTRTENRPTPAGSGGIGLCISGCVSRGYVPGCLSRRVRPRALPAGTKLLAAVGRQLVPKVTCQAFGGSILLRVLLWPRPETRPNDQRALLPDRGDPTGLDVAASNTERPRGARSGGVPGSARVVSPEQRSGRCGAAGTTLRAAKDRQFVPWGDSSSRVSNVQSSRVLEVAAFPRRGHERPSPRIGGTDGGRPRR